jgi:hypothetical protein
VFLDSLKSESPLYLRSTPSTLVDATVGHLPVGMRDRPQAPASIYEQDPTVSAEQ